MVYESELQSLRNHRKAPEIPEHTDLRELLY